MVRYVIADKPLPPRCHRLNGETWLTIRIHVPFHIAVYVRFVAAHAGTKEFRRFAALVFDVTI